MAEEHVDGAAGGTGGEAPPIDPVVAEEIRRRNAELDAVAREIEQVYAAARSDGGGGGPSPRPLSDKLVSASLSGLGHSAAGRLVYTQATLSSLSLSNVDALAKFKHLQKVLLDSNHLESVTALSACDSLVHVSLSNNALSDSVFADLRGAADTLQYIDVSHNRLTSLRGASEFKFLNTLLADANQIEELRAGEVSHLQSLWKLGLSANKIRKVHDGAFAHCPLRLLDVCKNDISDLGPFLDLTATLTVFGVEDNAVMHLTDVVQFTELSTALLAGNNLYDIAEVHQLADLRLLRNLSLLGNPLCSFGAMPDAPLDDDDASDIVCRDDDDDDNDDEDTAGGDGKEKARRRPPAANVVAAAAARRAADAPPQRVVPSATHAVALRHSRNAPFSAADPHHVDAARLDALSEEQRYRLHVIWRVSQLARLDGIEVTPDESVDANTLVGGVDRDARIRAERLLAKRAS